MELKVREYTAPSEVLFNYEELKNEITEKAEHYKNLVVTEDTIPAAKADRSSLNKLKKALNDDRIRREKEYMAPFNVFKDQIRELCNIIDEPIKSIDGQLKKFDDEEKEKKRAEIEKIYAEIGFPEYAPLGKIFDIKWLNKTTSLKKIKEELIEIRMGISKNEYTLGKLEEFSFEAMEIYKETLDLTKAIEEGQRLADIQKRKEEASKGTENTDVKEDKAEKNEVVGNVAETKAEVAEMPKEWVSFKALLSVDDAKALNEFFNARNIDFKAI